MAWLLGCGRSRFGTTDRMKPHPTLHIDIGKRLKECRLKQGLFQRALARRGGVTNGLISQIEQNSISPSIASLKKILDVLSMSLADFFTNDDGGKATFFYERRRLPDLASGGVA